MASADSPDLVKHAVHIWSQAVSAVRGDRRVSQSLQCQSRKLRIAGAEFALDEPRNLIVVGAGKAACAMARGVAHALGAAENDRLRVTGWVNAPRDPAGRVPLSKHRFTELQSTPADATTPCKSALGDGATVAVHIHPARPWGCNEPTLAAVEGTQQILRLVEGAQPSDIVLCLISGGASSLLVAPAAGITLEDKIEVARELSASGASIEEINTVRKHLSLVKGGKLAQRCRAGQLISLILSDILGDPLAAIGSGPTVPDPTTPSMALQILRQYRLDSRLPRVAGHLEALARQRPPSQTFPCQVQNHIVGNLQMALSSAVQHATRLGYHTCCLPIEKIQPTAEEAGHQLADQLIQLFSSSEPQCIISGGEPVVKLVPASERGVGGRNQQLVLAALTRLLEWRNSGRGEFRPAGDWVFLSAGTDGEDGPTTAAGAWFNQQTLDRIPSLRIDPSEFLRRNAAHTFFTHVKGLLITGVTETNVGDLRVLLWHPYQEPVPKRG